MRLNENFNYDKMLDNCQRQIEKNDLFIDYFDSKIIGIVKITHITETRRFNNDFDLKFCDYLIHFDIIENDFIEKLNTRAAVVGGIIEYSTDLLSIVDLEEELNNIKLINDINKCYKFLLTFDKIKLKRLFSLFQLKKIPIDQFYFNGKRTVTFTFERKPVFSQLLTRTIKDCFPVNKTEEYGNNLLITVVYDESKS